MQLSILNAIKNSIHTRNSIYFCLEDERLIAAVLTILENRMISNEQFEDWITNICCWKKTEQWHTEFKLLSNVRNFLSSLYFQLDDSETQYNQNFALIVKEKINIMMQEYR